MKGKYQQNQAHNNDKKLNRLIEKAHAAKRAKNRKTNSQYQRYSKGKR